MQKVKATLIFKCILILYWICAVVFFNLFYGNNFNTPTEKIIYTSVYFFISFIAVDIHYRFITQPNLKTQNYSRFIILSIFLFITVFWLESFTSFILHFYLLDLTNQTQNTSIPVKTQIGGVNMIVFGGIAIRFMFESFKLFKLNQEKEKQQIENELRLKEVELEQLKGQLNPHFLFNSLNCIYGLSLENSDRTPEVVLRLSSILDYILYQCKENVFISEEVNQLENYCSIQKERFGNLLNFSLSQSIKDDKKIAPLLLFTLVENAFKHAKPNQHNSTEVEIKINSSDKLELIIINSIDKESVAKKNKGGIGLINLNRRLELLYPNKHELTLTHSLTHFTTKLLLNLNTENE